MPELVDHRLAPSVAFELVAFVLAALVPAALVLAAFVPDKEQAFVDYPLGTELEAQPLH